MFYCNKIEIRLFKSMEIKRKTELIQCVKHSFTTKICSYGDPTLMVFRDYYLLFMMPPYSHLCDYEPDYSNK